MTIKLSRRQFGAAAIATVGAAALGGRPAASQPQRFVLGTYGGDTGRFIEELVLKPILEPKGIQTLIESAQDSQRLLKLQAERRLPRGTYDTVHCQAPILYRLHKEGLIENLDLSRLPFYDTLLQVLKTEYAIPHTASSRVILYNPNRISTPPTSFEDLWKPEYAGKVGLINQHYAMAISSAALTNGGSMSNYEPGKEKLLQLKKSGVQVYPSNEAFGQALQTEECWIGIMIQSRGAMWKRQGVPVEVAYAKEGIALDSWGFAIPKNARNKDAAYEFMNAALSDPAQTGWASNMWSSPPTSSALEVLDASVKSVIAPPANLQDKLIAVDQAYLAENDAQLKEWWDRVFNV